MATAPRRALPSRAAPAPAASPRSGGGYSGAEGRQQAAKAAADAKARQEAAKLNSGMPFRFFTPDGETKEIIVVDEAPDFFRYEHALKTPGTTQYNNFLECIAEEQDCPVCMHDSDRRPYFAMYLTIIDLTPYDDKKGNHFDFSKKLLVVKTKQQATIMRLYERHKSLRGMVLSMTRDGPMDAAIGGAIEFVEFIDEEDLITYVYDYEDKEGKVHDVDCAVPFDYRELFPQITARQLEAAVGAGPARGSREADDAALGRAAPAKRVAARREAPSRGVQEQFDDQQADDGVDDQQPAEAEAPSRRVASRRPAPEPEYVEEAPAEPPRRAAPARAAAAPAPVRRAAPATDEPPFDADDPDAPADDQVDPDPPQRSSRAAPPRRAAVEAEEPRARRAAPAPAARRAMLRR